MRDESFYDVSTTITQELRACKNYIDAIISMGQNGSFNHIYPLINLLNNTIKNVHQYIKEYDDHFDKQNIK